MEIQAQELCKSWNGSKVIQNFSARFLAGNAYAILGPNGSGKSTLLKVLAGYVRPDQGQLSWRWNGTVLERDQVYRHLAWCAPYLCPDTELTLKEVLTLHFKLKPLRSEIELTQVPVLLGLEQHLLRPVKYFSSGMLQKVKLGMALYADSPLLLLDEPMSNLDQKAQEWLVSELQEWGRDRLQLVASNRPEEYRHCSEHFHLSPQGVIS